MALRLQPMVFVPEGREAHVTRVVLEKRGVCREAPRAVRASEKHQRSWRRGAPGPAPGRVGSACPGRCTGGGQGQVLDGQELEAARVRRAVRCDALHDRDDTLPVVHVGAASELDLAGPDRRQIAGAERVARQRRVVRRRCTVSATALGSLHDHKVVGGEVLVQGEGAHRSFEVRAGLGAQVGPPALSR